MTPQNIYDILSKYPHNSLYLKRYIKYILLCKSQNLKLSGNENHHILPKAKDMFPEFSNLKEFPWNSVHVTYKQHIMAHIILQKAFPEKKSCYFSVWQMFIKPNKKYKSENLVIALKMASKMRSLVSISLKNTIPAVDLRTGLTSRMKKDLMDENYISCAKHFFLDLEKSKENRLHKKIRLKNTFTAYDHKSEKFIRANITDNRLISGEIVGAGALRDKESRNKTGIALKNRIHIYDKNTGERKFIKKQESYSSNFERGITKESRMKMSESGIGNKFYTNLNTGVQTKSKECPEGYVSGRTNFGSKGNFFEHNTIAFDLFSHKKVFLLKGMPLPKNLFRSAQRNSYSIVIDNLIIRNYKDFIEFKNTKDNFKEITFSQECFSQFIRGNKSIIKIYFPNSYRVKNSEIKNSFTEENLYGFKI